MALYGRKMPLRFLRVNLIYLPQYSTLSAILLCDATKFERFRLKVLDELRVDERSKDPCILSHPPLSLTFFTVGVTYPFLLNQ